jgi:hypothetical protein
MHQGDLMAEPSEPRWLLLIHQIPPKPNYLRVKIWRRLQRLGAVAVKNSVYVLPRSDQAQEDFEWVAREIVEGGGEASICEARFVDGLTDRQVVGMFHDARNEDYAQVAQALRRLMKGLGPGSRIEGTRRARAESTLARLKRRMLELSSIDVLGAPGRREVDQRLRDLGAKLRMARRESRSPKVSQKGAGRYHGRIWVTRKGIFVDRMASGWLIRRFIDKDARFKFVPSKGYRPEPGELRFDMFEAEFTHEGDLCTFEVLLSRFSLPDPALRDISEIVHDIDLKDSKFGRQDAFGFERLVAGIAMTHKDDAVRLDRACAVLDDLAEYFRRKPSHREGRR